MRRHALSLVIEFRHPVSLCYGYSTQRVVDDMVAQRRSANSTVAQAPVVIVPAVVQAPVKSAPPQINAIQLPYIGSRVQEVKDSSDEEGDEGFFEALAVTRGDNLRGIKGSFNPVRAYVNNRVQKQRKLPAAKNTRFGTYGPAIEAEAESSSASFQRQRQEHNRLPAAEPRVQQDTPQPRLEPHIDTPIVDLPPIGYP